VYVALRNQVTYFVGSSVYALNVGVMKLADKVYLLAGQGVTLKERLETLRSLRGAKNLNKLLRVTMND